jgi:hypothetical protein
LFACVTKSTISPLTANSLLSTALATLEKPVFTRNVIIFSMSSFASGLMLNVKSMNPSGGGTFWSKFWAAVTSIFGSVFIARSVKADALLA